MEHLLLIYAVALALRDSHKFFVFPFSEKNEKQLKNLKYLFGYAYTQYIEDLFLLMFLLFYLNYVTLKLCIYKARK